MKLNEEVGTISFRELRDLKDFGMIVMGAGGDPQEWVDGIENILKKEDIVTLNPPTFSRAAIIQGNVAGDEGRTDLLLVFNPESQVNVGKLAMWRLRFGDISWVEDFIANHGRDYRMESRSQATVNRLLN